MPSRTRCPSSTWTSYGARSRRSRSASSSRRAGRTPHDHDRSEGANPMSVSLEFARSLPKAEVHVHLEGCFEPEDLQALQGGPEDGAPAFTDLRGFLELLDRACASIETAEQAARMARRFAHREAEVGVRYADLLVSPVHWTAWDGRLGAFVDAIDAGLREAEE